MSNAALAFICVFTIGFVMAAGFIFGERGNADTQMAGYGVDNGGFIGGCLIAPLALIMSFFLNFGQMINGIGVMFSKLGNPNERKEALTGLAIAAAIAALIAAFVAVPLMW